MKILGISGSLRRGSYNTSLLGVAAGLLPDNVEFELWGGLKEVPPYDEDDDTEEAPAAAAALREAIAGADAVLFATPEYNSSVPGQLKNAIDWASRPLATNPLRNKPVAVVGGSTGVFGAVGAPTRFDEGGRLVDENLLEQLEEVVAGLVAAAAARCEALDSPLACAA